MKKITLKIYVTDEKSRSKALQLASSVRGVESVALRGKDRNHLVVTGERVDAVKLARTLQKKLSSVEIIGVGRDDFASVDAYEEPRYESSADHFSYVQNSYSNGYNSSYVRSPYSYSNYSYAYAPPPKYIVDEGHYDSNGCSIM